MNLKKLTFIVGGSLATLLLVAAIWLFLMAFGAFGAIVSLAVGMGGFIGYALYEQLYGKRSK